MLRLDSDGLCTAEVNPFGPNHWYDDAIPVTEVADSVSEFPLHKMPEAKLAVAPGAGKTISDTVFELLAKGTI